MISDIVLFIIAALMGLMHLLLLIPDAVFSIGNFNTAVLGTISWLFSPLRYFGYWIDLATLGKVINYAMLFLSGWYTWQLIRMGITSWSGKLEQPEI